MDDLISRAAALNAIDCWHIDFNSMDGARVQTDCWRTIKELPAVDAVPVVRCRDCKWGIVTTDEDCEDIVYCNNPDCPVWEADIAVKPDWYCADGERKDGESDG